MLAIGVETVVENATSSLESKAAQEAVSRASAGHTIILYTLILLSFSRYWASSREGLADSYKREGATVTHPRKDYEL